jgi:flagellin
MMAINISSSNPSYSLQSVLQAQLAQFKQSDEASSGKRISSAAVDPSGLAIYNNLTSQAQGADTANLNLTEAASAVNVAQGATSGVQSALGQINALAIEANNGFNSSSDNAALQGQANQLVQQINTDAAGANFNGTPLLTGPPSVSVQSGPNAGQTTDVSLPNATSAGLGIANIDLSNPAGATSAEGQIAGADATLAQGQAQVGAQSAALGAAIDNNNVLANNLTASAAALGDAGEAQAATGIASSKLQAEISYAVLARANADAGHLNSFLSQYA